MKINVIGAGYIGLPTALTFASNGFNVVATDLNEDLIKTLKNGNITFEEKGLKELFDDALKKSISFSTSCVEADYYIISVATPYDVESKKIDPKYVIAATIDVLAKCKKGSTIVIESTVSPGTISNYVVPIIKNAGFELNKDIFVAHAPERIIPGNMIYELSHNSRTIGCDNAEKGKEIVELYSKITTGSVILTSLRAAEMTKVVENTFRAINIAFANELLKICNLSNLDVREVINICNMHPRVNILQPGPGVGGHCIPVDPWFLVGDYPNTANLIKCAMEINESMPDYVLEKAYYIAKENNIKMNRIGIYGLTYKENVDDIRESPSLQLIEKHLKHLGDKLACYDPFVKKQIVADQYFDLRSFLDNVDFVIVMVKHNEIKDNTQLLEKKIVLDTQNVISSAFKLYKL